MGRQPCCDKVGLKKGPWTSEEDKKLITFILNNGQCCWRAVPKLAGLLRCGKSCRLRWTNYLRPDLKRGVLSEYEEKMVIDLHAKMGNRWSKIASHLPGRTDNEIKNHWNTHIKKKLKKLGIDPLTHNPISSSTNSNGKEKQRTSSSLTEYSTMETNIEAKEEEEESNKDKKKENSTMDMVSGFFLDEIPIPSSSSTSSSSCSNFLDILHLPDLDWCYNCISPANPNSLSLWFDDDFSSLDLFLNEYDGDRQQMLQTPTPT